jgi:DNA-binding winged helix-turn-helix (wHTH) protein
MPAYFADFVLDLATRELTRDGKSRHISGKALHLLEVLVRRAPNAVAKDDLYNELWGDAFVTEANLPNLVSELRDILGDDAASPRFVKTVHRFGYRFLEPVRWQEANADSSIRSWLTWGTRDFPLGEGEHVLGRDRGVAVALPVAGVSRRHAIIRVENAEAVLLDLESKNGTFLNGRRVAGPTPLHDGDNIRVGSVAVDYHVASEHDTTVTNAPGITYADLEKS